MNRILFAFVFLFVSLCGAFGQLNSKTEKDFESFSQYADNGDFKAGIFSVKKSEKFIAKKTGENSLEMLLLNCYKAQFLSELNEKEAFEKTITAIDNQIPLALKDPNTSGLLRVYKQHVKLFASMGIFIRSELIYEELNKRVANLSLIEQEELAYYKLLCDFKKGYLNEVMTGSQQHKSIVLSMADSDSVVKKKGTQFVKLKRADRKDRYYLAGKFFTLQLKALIENGLSDSALLKIVNEEQIYKDILSNQKGFLSELYSIKGECYLNQVEYKLAEKEFKSAIADAKTYYLLHYTPVSSIYHNLITALLGQNKNEEANYYINDIAVKVYGYYGKKSLGFKQNKYTDIEVLMIKHHWDKAEKEIKTFLESNLLPKEHQFRVDALEDLYYVNIKKHNFANADSLSKEVILAKRNLVGDSPALNTPKIKQAILYSNYLDRFDDAEKIYDDVLTKDYLDHVSVSNPEYYLAISSQSKLYEYKENFQKASKIIDSSLLLTQKAFGQSSENYARLINLKGAFEISTGKYEEANKDINASIEVFQSKNSKSSIKYFAEALELKAKLKIIEGDYKLADQYLGQATAAYAKISRLSTDDLFSIEEVGLLYIHTGKYNKADKYLRKILAEKEAGLGKDHKSTYNILNYLGELNVVNGNYSDAANYFDRSTAITKKVFGPNSIPYANSLVYQKKLYAILGDAESSAKSLKTAIDIYKKAYGEDNVKVGVLSHEYALAALEVAIQKKGSAKLKAELVTVLQKSLDLIKAKLTEKSPAYAYALEDAALFYVYYGEPKKSIDFINQSKGIWTNLLGDPNIHSARLEMLNGRILYNMAQYTESLNAFEKSKSIYGDLFDKSHPSYIAALGKSAQLYYILGQRNKAVDAIEYCVEKSLLYIKNVFPILSEKGKSAFWEKTKEDFEFYKTLTFSSDVIKDEMVSNVMNMQIQTRAILLNSQLKIKQQVLGSGDTLLISLYQDLLINRENLALAYSMTQPERKDAGLDVALLELQNEKLEKQLSSMSELFKNSSTKEITYDWKTLKKQLNNDEIIIEVTPFRLYTNKFTDTIWYAILALDASSGKPEYILLKNGTELQTKYLKNYRNCMKFGIEDNYSFENFWKPIQPLIKPKHKNIYFVRDGFYNQMNLETLKDQTGNYLLNTTKVHYIGTSRDVYSRVQAKKKSEGQSTGNITMFGNPDYYDADYIGSKQISQLPGSEIEVKKIDSLLSTTSWETKTYLNGNANEEQIKKIVNPKVLHISTHGFFVEEKEKSVDELRETAADNPLLRSGLLMVEGGELMEYSNVNVINKTDGILTAYEVLNLTLDKSELVVLSACETGLGEVKIGEGVLGLQRSFQVAGAKSVIMSIFKVSDEVTQKLMLSFYKNWITTGNKYESFILAKKEILEKYKDPIYWGAFIMIGAE